MHPKTKRKDALINTNNSIIRMYGSGYIRVPITQKSHTATTNKQFSANPKPKKT